MARKNFDEILKEFLDESSEGLQQLDTLLVRLENERDSARVADIFRVIHSIKGTSGLLGLNNLEMLAHAGEDLLTDIRDGNLIPNKEITTALLQMVDRIRAAIEIVAQKKSDAEFNAGSLITRLGLLKHSQADQAGLPRAETVNQAGPEAQQESAAAPAPSGVGTQHLRVDVSLLDKLMNMVGELVLVRNQILQLGHSNSAITASSQKLHQITTELQEGMMKTRMQPVSNLWDRVPRLVRDVSIICNKQVRVEFEGGETELDKTILESIKDPLTHLVRNAIDHGIEAPEARRAKGKPEEGAIILRAYHDGGQVCIEVSDDGQGIDTARIVADAIEKGSISADQAARLSEREQKALMFLPGISTSIDVTKVSGRGVGMDVVKTNTERIGGTVDILAAPHGGTCFRLTIPLTLAIIPALVVVSRGVRYAIPQVNILELVRLDADQAAVEIEQARGCSVYRLRGRLIPILYLHEVLRLKDKDAKQEQPSDGVNLVILQAGMHSFGLAVDDINDTEEIVVKPLARQLKGLTVCSGATIMGDGAVAMILDVIGLAHRAGVEVQNEAQSRTASEAAHETEIERLVIFRVGKNRRLAMPLNLVARLEEFPKDKLENSAGQLVVQYRGGVMPVVPLASVLNLESDSEGSGLAQVIVYEKQGKSVGLIVDEIVDIVEERLTVHEADFHKNIRGRAVIQGRVTDLLEIPHISDLWSGAAQSMRGVN
ncbi:MAG: chemotaxis protein CheA [Acidobacteriia bacterium]|nr:chemotaxis protein CheA [Terriglobia bacterium]